MFYLLSVSLVPMGGLVQCFVFWFMSVSLVLKVGCAELDALSSKVLQKSDKTIGVALRLDVRPFCWTV